MKRRPFSEKAPKEKAYFGTFLALSVFFLVAAILRTAGVVAGGPVPWYLWVHLVLMLLVDLYLLFGKKQLFSSENAEYIFLSAFLGLRILFSIFKDGIPRPGDSEFTTLMGILCLCVAAPFLIRRAKREEEFEAELEKRRQAQKQKEREEYLDSLRRSMAPTKQPQDASPDPEETQRDEE